MTRHIPNLITCLNLAAGFISVILILNGNIVPASWVIILAMIFDFLDGFFARMLHAYSELGKQLDSLSDLVSFGVAPGLIIYSIFTGNVASGPQTWYTAHPYISIIIAVLISSLMAICGALRLAKFNIDTEQSESFKGLPIPANALAVVSLVLSARYSDSEILKNIAGSPMAMTLISVSLSLLMVSRLDMLSLKFKNYSLKGNGPRYILVAVSGISLIIAGSEALSLIIPFYIIISVIDSIVKHSTAS
jgi:CDP-diacylglycerol---serine O-phosphatidyltransferase